MSGSFVLENAHSHPGFPVVAIKAFFQFCTTVHFLFLNSFVMIQNAVQKAAASGLEERSQNSDRHGYTDLDTLSFSILHTNVTM